MLGSILDAENGPDDDPFLGNHLAVSFDTNEGHFVMRDLKTGAGTYVRLDNFIEIKSGHTVVFGSSAIVFKISDDDKHSTVSFSFVSGPKEGEAFAFGQGKTITIGRLNQCDVCVDEKQLSRVQSTIEHIDDKWMIRDGDGAKLTTNGTWLYLTSPLPITDGLFFRLGRVSYKAAVIQAV